MKKIVFLVGLVVCLVFAKSVGYIVSTNQKIISFNDGEPNDESRSDNNVLVLEGINKEVTIKSTITRAGFIPRIFILKDKSNKFISGDIKIASKHQVTNLKKTFKITSKKSL